MDITKDMRTTKHLLEENWQNDSSLIEQSRNASLPEHENNQKMSQALIWIVGEGVSECWCRAGV